MIRSMHPKNMQRGFSLLEVLITMVILALGLLGFAGLQSYSLKSNHIAMQRSLATMYSYSILDSMRANRTVAIANGYNQTMPGAAPACTAPVATGVVVTDDLAYWNNGLACNLPSGMGSITVVGSTATISIKWTENVSSGENGTQTFTTVTNL